jgi:hypothetical protein
VVVIDFDAPRNLSKLAAEVRQAEKKAAERERIERRHARLAFESWTRALSDWCWVCGDEGTSWARTGLHLRGVGVVSVSHCSPHAQMARSLQTRISTTDDLQRKLLRRALEESGKGDLWREGVEILTALSWAAHAHRSRLGGSLADPPGSFGHLPKSAADVVWSPRLPQARNPYDLTADRLCLICGTPADGLNRVQASWFGVPGADVLGPVCGPCGEAVADAGRHPVRLKSVSDSTVTVAVSKRLTGLGKLSLENDHYLASTSVSRYSWAGKVLELKKVGKRPKPPAEPFGWVKRAKVSDFV